MNANSSYSSSCADDVSLLARCPEPGRPRVQVRGVEGEGLNGNTKAGGLRIPRNLDLDKVSLEDKL